GPAGGVVGSAHVARRLGVTNLITLDLGGTTCKASIVEEGRFDPAAFATELDAAPGNREVGTSLWFENERVRVWEVRLEPGERGPFHAHTRPYLWTCVEPGLGKQRSPDGTVKVRRYAPGETQFSEHSAESPMLHDLENAGETTLRFVTVELLG
ncbi:MAG: hydantoinase/oxoprolinase family protein, partial [Actinomycetota bacterium]